MEGERLERIESRLAELEKAVGDLTARLARAEATAPGTPALAVAVLAPGAAPAAAPPAPEGVPAALPPAEAAPAVTVNMLSLAGRSFLFLGGAFLLRSLTDAGTLPSVLGVPLGLAYGLGLALLSDRAAARGARWSGVFHALTGVAITYPIVWEATTRLQLFPAPVAAALLGLLTAVTLAVARRHDLSGLAWVSVLAAVASALGLLGATGALSSFTLLLLAVGLATLWLAADRGWPGLPWPAALAVDLAVFQGVLLATRRGGAPEPWNTLSPGTALALAVALPLAYLVAVVGRTIARHEGVGFFDIAQIHHAFDFDGGFLELVGHIHDHALH